jgi:hypothetical protein
MLVDNKSERIWNESIVAKFRVISRNLFLVTEDKHEKSQDVDTPTVNQTVHF